MIALTLKETNTVNGSCELLYSHEIPPTMVAWSPENVWEKYGDLKRTKPSDISQVEIECLV